MILCVLPYFYWYFESLVVLAVLLGLDAITRERKMRTAGFIALGVLLKLFPALSLTLVWKKWPWRKALQTTVIVLAICLVVYLALFAGSVDFTVASLVSQGHKGSWETVWALIDQNLRTGNFGELSLRLDPLSAFRPMGNAAVISPWITLAILGGFGFWRWLKARPVGWPELFSLLGFTWTIFFLWLPGWSVQWVVYLVLIVLLTLPLREGLLFCVVLILANLMEWPVLLSRGYFSLLPLTVGLRTLLLILLAFEFDRGMNGKLAGDL